MRRPPLALRLAPLLILLLTVPGCGIEFVASEEGTELIDSVTVSGEFVAGGEVMVTVTINQAYPVPVHVACYAQNESLVTEDEKDVSFHERATLVGQVYLDTAIGPSGAMTPDTEVQKQTFSYPFRVERPGTYFIACITPAAPDNGVGRTFTVRGGLN
jgi:hypothetical protein